MTWVTWKPQTAREEKFRELGFQGDLEPQSAIHTAIIPRPLRDARYSATSWGLAATAAIAFCGECAIHSSAMHFSRCSDIAERGLENWVIIEVYISEIGFKATIRLREVAPVSGVGPYARTLLQSVFSTLSQGLEDDIVESSLGRWADTARTYCPVPRQALANCNEIQDKTLRQSGKPALYMCPRNTSSSSLRYKAKQGPEKMFFLGCASRLTSRVCKLWG